MSPVHILLDRNRIVLYGKRICDKEDIRLEH